MVYNLIKSTHSTPIHDPEKILRDDNNKPIHDPEKILRDDNNKPIHDPEKILRDDNNKLIHDPGKILRDDNNKLTDWLLDAPQVALNNNSASGGICSDLLGLDGSEHPPDLGACCGHVLWSRALFVLFVL